jgi:H+/Cl- antiporter ClcA
MRALAWRTSAIAVGFGAVAGAIAAVTLKVMLWLQGLVWGVSDARWYFVVAILVGGVLVALLRRVSEEANLEQEVALTADPVQLHRRRIGFLAVSAIVAVAFGGAVGPEAGLIAVVAEVSSLAAFRMAKSREEQRLIGRVGSAAALSGLYGSPPGGAVYESDEISPSKALVFVAAVVGLVAFLLTSDLFGGLDMPPLGLPEYLTSHDGSDLLRAIPPAIAAALGATAYTMVRPALARLVGRLSSTTLQTMLATLLFAGLAVLWPILRFSGHSDFPQLVSMAGDAAWWSLLGVGLLKLLACAVCLAGGYRGGEFFPLMFAGAAVGVATVSVVPGLQITGALVAGLAAATTVGLRKPVAALLIGLFVVQGTALGPLVVGVAVGVLALRLLGLRNAAEQPARAGA